MSQPWPGNDVTRLPSRSLMMTLPHVLVPARLSAIFQAEGGVRDLGIVPRRERP